MMLEAELTSEQQELVALLEGCYLVVAPPGSGKTEVIAHRIVRLLAFTQERSTATLALSFTRAAASSLRTRVMELMGEYPRRVTFSTYHAFCHDVLLHYGHLAGLPRELTLYDNVDDRLQALRQGLVNEDVIGEDEPLDRAFGIEALDEIGKTKRALVLPSAASERALSRSRWKLSTAYRGYENALERNGAIDFDGLLVRAYQLLVDSPQVAAHYRGIYEFILIDEAQDTSAAQYEVLRALCGSKHRNVFMVADPGQSIYGFTGASSKYVERFAEEFQAERRVLSVTFRCADAILKVAAKLAVKPRPIEVRSAAPGCVSYEEFASESQEASAAVDWATSLVDDGLPRTCLGRTESTEINREEVAFLARSRVHLTALVGELTKRQLPFHFHTGDSGIFDSDEYRAILYALKVLANPRDVAIERSLLACLATFLDGPPNVGDSRGVELLGRLSLALRDHCLATPFSLLAEASSVSLGEVMERLAQWQPAAVESDSQLGELLVADATVLAERWRDYVALVDERDRTWQGLVMEIVSKPKPEAPGFRVSTVHAAKGLEFKAVSLLGLNEGSFPDFRNSEDSKLIEEQRLAYVAATRASRVLRVSRPRVRETRYGGRVQQPSRFLVLAGLLR